jgi:hypothetical protein
LINDSPWIEREKKSLQASIAFVPNLRRPEAVWNQLVVDSQSFAHSWRWQFHPITVPALRAILSWAMQKAWFV